MTEQPSLWIKLKGQDLAVERLQKIIAEGKIGHAYLFLGPRGVGKSLAAKLFAAALNCPWQCGSCSVCRSFLNLTSQNLLWLEPEGNQIVLPQVAEIAHFVQLKNAAGEVKVVVINEADSLNQEAANALLKVLEEPATACVFILVSDLTKPLLPTIISRCQVVNFTALPPAVVEDILLSSGLVEPSDAKLAAAICGGKVGDSELLIKAGLLSYREQLLYQLVTENLDLRLALILTEQIVNKVNEIVKAQTEQLFQAQVELDQWLQAQSKLAKKVELQNKRLISKVELGAYRLILQLLGSIFRDLFLLEQNLAKKFIINTDFLVQLNSLRLKIKPEKALEAVKEAQQRLSKNVKPRLVLENFFLSLGG
jgi:DNA polymerase III delta' subunit